MRKMSFGQKFILTVMTVALSLVAVYAASMTGGIGYALVIIASVLMYIPVCEGLYVPAIFVYVLSSVISFVICPDKIAVAIYACLPGHYAIFRSATDKVIYDKVISFCIKLLYCNVWAIGVLCLVIFGLHISVPTNLPLPMWLCVMLTEAVFILFELFHTFSKWLYIEVGRSSFVPKQ